MIPKQLLTLAVLVSTAATAKPLPSVPALNLATADSISQHCQQQASKAGYNLSIAIYDAGGWLISFARMPGASPATVEVAQWKGKSAALYQTATAETAKWNIPMAPQMASVGGGIPLFTEAGVPVGGVGVSGAPPEFDAACGAEAAKSVGLAR